MTRDKKTKKPSYMDIQEIFFDNSSEDITEELTGVSVSEQPLIDITEIINALAQTTEPEAELPEEAEKEVEEQVEEQLLIEKGVQEVEEKPTRHPKQPRVVKPVEKIEKTKETEVFEETALVKVEARIPITPLYHPVEVYAIVGKHRIRPVATRRAGDYIITVFKIPPRRTLPIEVVYIDGSRKRFKVKVKY